MVKPTVFHYQRPYDVIATDYNSYAVTYSCRVRRSKRSLFFMKKKEEFVWILTRKPLNVFQGQEDLDTTDADMKEYNRIRKLTKKIVEEALPDYPFEDQQRITI